VTIWPEWEMLLDTAVSHLDVNRKQTLDTTQSVTLNFIHTHLFISTLINHQPRHIEPQKVESWMQGGDDGRRDRVSLCLSECISSALKPKETKLVKAVGLRRAAPIRRDSIHFMHKAYSSRLAAQALHATRSLSRFTN
jgi:hypothetical protein